MARVRFGTLFSGSSANCTFIEVDGDCILIDAGAGVKKTAAALHKLDSDYHKIKGIFITHEHSDHIGGLKTILRYNKIPVIANGKTLRVMRNGLHEYEDCFCEMATGASASCAGFCVTSFLSSHDSAECVGYMIDTGTKKLGVLTDCGRLNNIMIQMLSKCEAVVLESNHDLEMLMTGVYPYMLKRRVAGEGGHLSNKQCADGLCELVGSGVKQVFLAHLSKENNTPAVAVKTISETLLLAGIKPAEDVMIHVAPRDEISHILEF